MHGCLEVQFCSLLEPLIHRRSGILRSAIPVWNFEVACDFWVAPPVCLMPGLANGFLLNSMCLTSFQCELLRMLGVPPLLCFGLIKLWLTHWYCLQPRGLDTASRIHCVDFVVQQAHQAPMVGHRAHALDSTSIKIEKLEN